MKFITESDDEAEPSQAENFFMFLHRAKAHHRLPELFRVFNTEFPFEKVIETNMFYLEDREREYADRVCADAVLLDNERYVHISNFSADPVVKRKLNRCLEKLPNSEPDTAEVPSTVALLEDEVGDEEVAIDLAEERALVLSSALSAGPSTSTITPNEDDVNNEQGDLPLACFPSFRLCENLDFVLLIDIMHSFNIHEDYCLAAIANFSELQKDFVEDDDLDQFLLVDFASKDTEYRSGNCVIKIVFDEWKTCEASLPSDEEHTTTTKRIGFEDFGKFPQPAHHEDSKSTIDIWRPNVLETDENQQVYVYDDSFLRRAGGPRSSATGSSSSPRHQKTQHYRNTSKTSIPKRFLGGKHIALNTKKVILVEKRFALRVFGQGPGCQALRCGYYLGYSAAAIAAGIKDPETLLDYGKRALIMSKKGRSIQGATVPGIELSIEEVTAPRIELPAEETNEEAEGRPEKRMKPAELSSRNL
ncbi:hypothetical protein L7F22_004881 [Adiantum nelumboides]|nr:hypothetical protein [Adiantum nelumboides]